MIRLHGHLGSEVEAVHVSHESLGRELREDGERSLCRLEPR